MTVRIAIGGFLHESHSFAPRPTPYPISSIPAGFPPAARRRPCSTPCAAPRFRSPARSPRPRRRRATLVPLAWCFANPAGPVQDEAFERIAAADLRAAVAGAGCRSARRHLSRSARRRGGGQFPGRRGRVAAPRSRHRRRPAADHQPRPACEPDARRWSTLADAAVPFRTYPHVDMRAAGAQAMRLLLARIARGAPWARAFRQLDFWIPLGSQCTLVPPMAGRDERARRAGAAHGVAELAFCFGFPYADFADCGAALAAYADTQEAADAAADAFAALVAAQEASFAPDDAARRRGGRRRRCAGARTAGGDRRHAGQSRRRRPWRYHRPAGASWCARVPRVR